MGQLFLSRRAGPLTLALMLALGYYLFGRLALLMAIPPGYATAVWPAAGLALAGLLRYGYRVWPGIVLGSFFINFPTAFADADAVLPAAVVALILGSGAALQALAGTFLVRWCIDEPIAYAHADRIGALLALGGPVACLVSATVGVATLWATGMVPPADIGFHWFTWWVGDTIGVLLVMPVFLAWSAPRELLSRRNKILATVPVLALLSLVTLLFVRTSALEQQRIEDEFAQRSQRVAQSLIQEFAEYSEVLHAIAGFYSVSVAAVDRDEFRRLVADMLVRHPGLHALSWSPRVSLGQRASYEQTMQDEGYPQVRIRELGPLNALVPAAPRAEYFPVTYIEPLGRNATALGFDLASEHERRETLALAGDTGKPTASSKLELVQAAPGQPGVLVVAPAYWPGLPHVTREQRRQALRGYASAVLSVDEMMAVFLSGLELQNMQVRLLDADAAPALRVLHAEKAQGVRDVSQQQGANGPTLTRTVPLEIGGRSWRLIFSLAPDYPAANRSRVAWSVLIAGLLFTGLFSAFLLVTVGRTASVEAEVQQRTAELEQANSALKVSVSEHARSEAALRESEDQARAIVKTARDAYIAMDDQGRIQDWNNEAEVTFGWTHEEVVGRTVTDVIIPETHRGSHADGISNFLATGKVEMLNQRIEITALHRDGHEFPIELTVWATPFGTTHRFHAFLHDISERQRAIQRLAAQEAAAAALVESTTLDEAGPKVLRSICTALGWRVGMLWMIDPEVGALRCQNVWQQDPEVASAFASTSFATLFHKNEGLPGRVWATAKPLWIPDVTVDEDFPRASLASRDGLHAAFGFPVVSSGEVLGMIEFFADSIEPPDDGLLAMMDTLGNLLGEFAARKRVETALFEEKERAEVTLRSIGDGVIVIDTLGRITYLNPIAEEMTGWSARDALGHPVTEVLRVVDHQSGEPGLNPLLMALRENRTLGLAANSDLVRRDGFQTPIEDSAAPIRGRDGELLGSVMVFHDISESRAMALKMSHLAQHDYLTDLPNRVLLQDRFAQAIGRAKREHGHLALLYSDLDGFKHINDSLGHEVGDLLLQQVSQRLLHSVRSVDTVSRQGGDEFVILLPEIRSSSDAVRVADHILQAMREPFQVADTELNVTLSIGIAMYPSDGSDPGVLLKYADAAMYQAKQHGRNQYRFYTRAISERADRRLSIEGSLHQALRNDEFVLHYQPKVEPGTGEITGMEALVRWQPPNGELTYPDDFIEIAEETGLISRIDQWVLEEACRQNRAWQLAGLRRVPIAVNLSAAHANAERYAEELATILERTGLEPDCLHIEITESQMLRDTERFDTLIRGIKAVGVKVAIDDFGTGYSSLSYLCRFPFDVLKIDRTFVQSLEVDSKEIAIVEAITRLARTLDYVVVAEGVETLAQAKILQAHGCHEMQGYLYSRPVPAAQFEGLLRARRIVPQGQTQLAI
jgi:diguanylate cyclase (GGDEF)-like protein/PAS domain S-box-containing protein